MLTENPAVGRSFIAPNRVRPDHYKGMSPAEQAAVLDGQATQRMQAMAIAAANKAENEAADGMMEATRRAGAYQDAQVAAIIDAGLMPVLVRLMGNETSTASVKQQAAWCVINAADAVMPSQASQFADAGCIKALCDLLTDSSIIPSPVAPLQALLRQIGRAHV